MEDYKTQTIARLERIVKYSSGGLETNKSVALAGLALAKFAEADQAMIANMINMYAATPDSESYRKYELMRSIYKELGVDL